MHILTFKIGGTTGSKTDGFGRKKKQRAIHKVEAEENLYFLAHLSSDHTLHVSPQA
jgi:hypothetical protein